MSITDEVGVRIKGDLATQFKEKCMAQGIKYTDALRTLVQAYVDGKIEIQAQNAYITKTELET